MTREAEQAWQLFLGEVRETAPPEVDADDLVETLTSHLEDAASGDRVLDHDRIDDLIAGLRRDVLAELQGEGSARPVPAAPPPTPDWVNLGLLAAGIVAVPLVGPLLLFASWIWSRYLLWSRPRPSPLDALPSVLFSAALLLGLPLMSGFALASMLAELRPAPAFAYFLLAGGTALLLFAALLCLRLFAALAFRAIFAPLDRFGSFRMLRNLLVAAAAAGILISVGAILFLAGPS
jgi:hypothetical protein